MSRFGSPSPPWKRWCLIDVEAKQDARVRSQTDRFSYGFSMLMKRPDSHSEAPANDTEAPAQNLQVEPSKYACRGSTIRNKPGSDEKPEKKNEARSRGSRRRKVYNTQARPTVCDLMRDDAAHRTIVDCIVGPGVEEGELKNGCREDNLVELGVVCSVKARRQ